MISGGTFQPGGVILILYGDGQRSAALIGEITSAKWSLVTDEYDSSEFAGKFLSSP